MASCGKRRDVPNRLPSRYALETRYGMGGLIGSGCSGCVRECIDLRNRQRHACKTISRRGRCLSWSDAYEDARLEVDMMRTVSVHPHVVDFRESFEDASGIHLVMELCEGGDLFDEIKKGYFPEWLAAHIFRQVVDAVSFCHSLGILHRDLKPENVFLTRRLSGRTAPFRCRSLPNFRSGDKEALPYVKLGDFGLAVRVDSGACGFAGSPFYAAPEVIKGKMYGLSADVWSLGVILYALLAGSLPFAGETDQETFRQVCKGRPSFSSSTWDNVSSEAKILIRQMLALDPRCRPSALQILCHPWLQAMCRSLGPAPSSTPPDQSVLPSKAPETAPSSPSRGCAAKSLIRDDQELCDAPSTPGGSCCPVPLARRPVQEAHSNPRFPLPSRKNCAFHQRTQRPRSASPSPLSFSTPPPLNPGSRTLSNPPCPSPLTLSPLAGPEFPSHPSAFSLDPCTLPTTRLYAMSASSPPDSPYSSPSPSPSPPSMLHHSALHPDSETPFLALKPNCGDYMLSEDGNVLFTSNKLAKPKTLLGATPRVREHVGNLQPEPGPNPASSSSSPFTIHRSKSEKNATEPFDGEELVGWEKGVVELGRREGVRVVSWKEGCDNWRVNMLRFLQIFPWGCLQGRYKPVTKSDSPNDVDKG